MAKVCGLASADEVAMVLAAGADLVGFLHHPPSPRHCPDLALARLAKDRSVLVAVAPDAAQLLTLVAQARPAWVQPYVPVAERAEALRRLRALGVKVLLPWPDEPDQEPLEADLYLWETSPRATGLLGGSGQGHAMGFPPPGPFLLGGGLRAAILGERLAAMPVGARLACLGFDAASRLEAATGGKDPGLVETYVDAAHALERSEP